MTDLTPARHEGNLMVDVRVVFTCMVFTFVFAFV